MLHLQLLLLAFAVLAPASTAVAPATQEPGATIPVADDETAKDETIEVRLSTDGINFVPIYVGWSYDGALNALVFDLDHIPDNGDIIEAEYTVLGDCED